MRFFIELSYNGKYFYGWQVQKQVSTVEGHLEYCLSKLLKKSINVIGAGRTDKGVHAKQMFAHFDYDYEEIIINNKKLLEKLNIFLPRSINILNIFPVKENVHARFNAIKRTYKYYLTREKNPFYQDFSWYCFYPLNIRSMITASRELIKYQDFSSFKKKSSSEKGNNICQISHACWSVNNNILCFTIEANRFLRSMVRSIIGTLINVGRNKTTLSEFIEIIESKNSNFCKPIVPASGLFLTKILYPEDIFL
ncbi:tRNA pseudouridine(38-40) synthase TruA [Blattabacterium cuenoti]|uniref:tRNA pseudouridine(38-40) synthase TruA n=1 Tax=Blattabacterium cuenoti TaxID=1653831 RepID=UPI00163BF88F|nr:tRNA pseudouridine(38-40) synthase TruA [Blattabacterium cuenoti]